MTSLPLAQHCLDQLGLRWRYAKASTDLIAQLSQKSTDSQRVLQVNAGCFFSD